MIQTVEAIIDNAGRVLLLGEVHVTGYRRALGTVLDEPAAVSGEAALRLEDLGSRQTPNRKMQDILEQIETIHKQMNPKEGRSSVELVREVREEFTHGPNTEG